MKKSLTQDTEALLTYNTLDCVATALIFEQMMPEFDARTEALYIQHRELARIAAEMHTEGWPVDEENRQWLAWFLREKLNQEREKVVKLVGIPGFRATPDDMRALIFKRHATSKISRFNLEDPYDKRMWTEGGKIRVAQDALLLLMTSQFVPPELVEIIDVYWEASGAQKELGTFVESKRIFQAIGPDGRLRPSWNTCGTDTGRWSCSQPNMMNLPQTLRYMYRAPSGHVIVHADKTALELNVMAAVSRDRQLKKNLATGDVYTEDAKMMFDLPASLTRKELDKKYPGTRQLSKIGHLSFQYEATTGTLYSAYLGFDRTTKFKNVQFFHRKLKAIYADTVAYWAAEKARVMACGYSETRIMKRRRYYPVEPAGTETSNYPVQGTAADIMNIETIELDKTLKRCVPSAKMVGQLHDALDVFAPARHQGEVRRIMEDVLGTRQYEIEGEMHVFKTEVKIGETWDQV